MTLYCIHKLISVFWGIKLEEGSVLFCGVVNGPDRGNITDGVLDVAPMDVLDGGGWRIWEYRSMGT